ncbi:MAG: hypothetical protein V4591_10040 [Bdellovibrionota bacterium]
MKLNLFFIITTFLFISCSDKGDPYYVVDKIRTPTAQVYSQTSQTGQGCVTGVFDTNTWCQQFPIRPAGTVNAASTGKVKLRFLALAPSGNPVTLTLTQLKIFDMSLVNGSSGDGARGINPSTPATAISMNDFSFNLNTSLSATVQTIPMQVQTIVFDLEPPTLNKLIHYAQQNKFFPGFVLFYEASTPNLSYVDHGYFTFYLLPDPTDTSSWATLNASLSSFVSSDVFAQAFRVSYLNTPIQINNVSPASGSTIAAEGNNNISAQLTYNPSAFSFSPVQWYVSSGTMDNDRALSTSWNPNKDGAVSSLFVARDLLGGVDYMLSNYTAQ